MKIFALGLVVAGGAFAQKIEIEFDRAVDFSKFRTFAIRDGRLNSKNPSLNSVLIRKRIDADIRRYLEAKGLAFVPDGRSGLNVRYTLGSAGWWGTRVVRVPYTEGTLVLDLRDPGTRSLAIAREEKSNAARRHGQEVFRQVPVQSEITDTAPGRPFGSV